jgi:hypothetical protein
MTSTRNLGSRGFRRVRGLHRPEGFVQVSILVQVDLCNRFRLFLLIIRRVLDGAIDLEIDRRDDIDVGQVKIRERFRHRPDYLSSLYLKIAGPPNTIDRFESADRPFAHVAIELALSEKVCTPSSTVMRQDIHRQLVRVVLATIEQRVSRALGVRRVAIRHLGYGPGRSAALSVKSPDGLRPQSVGFGHVVNERFLSQGHSDVVRLIYERYDQSNDPARPLFRQKHTITICLTRQKLNIEFELGQGLWIQSRVASQLKLYIECGRLICRKAIDARLESPETRWNLSSRTIIAMKNDKPFEPLHDG